MREGFAWCGTTMVWSEDGSEKASSAEAAVWIAYSLLDTAHTQRSVYDDRYI